MNFRSFLVIMLMSLGLAACDNSNDEPDNTPTVISFDIEPKISVLDIGTSENFKALVTYSDGEVSDVTATATWSLKDQSGIIEQQDSPNDSGDYYAVAVKAGSDEIVATLGDMTTSSSVTVVEADLIALEITPTEASLPIGTETYFSAQGTYSDGHTQDLTDESTWSTFENAPVGNVVSITGKGVVSAINQGTAKVDASLGGLTSNAAVINVNDPKEIVLVYVTPVFKQMFVDTYQQFSARAYYSDGSVDIITSSALWLSSDTSVAAEDLFRKGQFNARGVGSAVITAEFGLGNQGAAFIDVKEDEIENIVVTPRDVEVPVGQTRRYFTEALLSDGSQASVNSSNSQYYSVENPDIAYISNDPENKGELTGLSAGTTTIRSTFIYEDETFTDETTVNIIP